ncbi:PIN domain nuclease [Eggerthella sinensis]|uniref:PIN domain nuclease n=2 Tax=Eggerthella sinensis TaxID=242230 RepID=A0A3N0IW08_9ACTN|nr:PIN domain nuclease [Eggerthella sinensis]RNM40522.1 PIN domain nuclease [Eggerthella sinensis]
MRGKRLRRRSMLSALDANAALRYLLWGVEDQAEQVREAVLEGASIDVVVLAEVVYVLAGVYRFSRTEIDMALENLIDDVSMFDEHIVRSALRMYAMSRLDFVDCWLIARNVLTGEHVLTFDKAMLKLLR